MRATFNGEGTNGKDETREFDMVLVAVGRRPVTDNLNLAAAGLSTDEKGFIAVDQQQRTKVPNIFAIGDVTGAPLLAHRAMKQGVIAAEVISGDKSAAFDPVAVPNCVYTDPEVATVGLSEEEAKAAGYEVRIGKFPLAASGRARTMNETDGLIKLVGDAKSDLLLGMHIVAPQAESLIGEGVIALEMGATLEDIGLSVHPHPTLTEGIMDAAEAAHGKAIHIVNPKPKAPVAARLSCARLLDLGLRPYREVWELQRRLHEAVRDGREPDTWIVVEHPPVVTLGRQAKRENLLLSPEALAARGIDVVEIERGGDVTYHGPGQLVVYPIRRLERFREVVPFVRALEGAVIECCARFGVAGERWSEHAGVWVGDKQICAIGLAVEADGFDARHRAQRRDRARLRSADQSVRIDRSRHHVALRARLGARCRLPRRNRCCSKRCRARSTSRCVTERMVA